MEFQIIWFILWGVLWAVYFMLDGFDFGVGMLHSFIGKNDAEKRTAINTIGPVWDGNEVWLITAGGATFAAFPDNLCFDVQLLVFCSPHYPLCSHCERGCLRIQE